MPDSSTSSQGAASGRCGGGRWWPSAGFAVPGSRCGRRAPRPKAAAKLPTRYGETPGSFGHTYWLISGAPTPGYSRDLAITGPGRQAWRAGGVPLIPVSGLRASCGTASSRCSPMRTSRSSTSRA